MIRRHTLLLIAALLTFGASPLVAQQTVRPDFTGTWIMDTVRSNRDGVLSSLTLTVTLVGDTLLVQSDGMNAGGSFTTKAKYEFSGRPIQNDMGGVVLTSTASWQKAAWSFTSTGTAGGHAILIEDSWSLDATGRVLTRRTTQSIDGRRRPEVLVLTRRMSLTGAPQSAGAGGPFIGDWEGALINGTKRLKMGLSVQSDSSGGLRGQLVSIDQGNTAIPSTISVHGDTLVVSMPAVPATYTAMIAPRDDSLRGTLVQGTSYQLVMGRTRGPSAEMRRPQVPQPPFPYETREVVIASVPGVQLAGTVIIPNGRGPFPAVVFVTGSGPQDRDETFAGHRPFLVIADYLARHGIASLRYDDRGTARSTGSFTNATSADFAADAEAAVHFLSGISGIARDRVGIIGHSEGGLIGPLAATHDRAVAFVVMMAGPGIAGDSISLLQQRAAALSRGVPAARVDAALANNQRLFHALNAAPDSASAAASLVATRDQIIAAVPDSQRALAKDRLDQNIAELLHPWMRFYMRYDPRPALRKVKVPVLAIGGSLDMQVLAKENLPAIEAALKAGGNRDFRVVELPGLNHLFQTATTGSPSEYATIEETVSPTALDLIVRWINERFNRR